jgi:acyl carrier protein
MLNLYRSLLEAIVSRPELHLSEIAETKLDRRDTHRDPQSYSKSRADAGYIPLQTPTEEIVAGVWSTLLHQQEIGAQSDFFDLGGHSLLALKVIMRLRTNFDLEIPLRYIFEHSTVRSFASKIDEMQLEKEQQELELLLAEIESVSEEEAEAFVAQISGSFSDNHPVN